MKFLKEATHIRYVLGKLSKFVQISKQNSSDSFLLELVFRPHFSQNFLIKNFFRYITLTDITSQVIQ